jgi:hypothetical protein
MPRVGRDAFVEFARMELLSDFAFLKHPPSSGQKKLAEIGTCANTKTTFFNKRF